VAKQQAVGGIGTRLGRRNGITGNRSQRQQGKNHSHRYS